MTISLIWAEGNNGEIGLNNKLPWRLKNDMKHFRETTMGKLVIMGRKTFESLHVPLKGRTNVIMTRDPEPVWAPPGVWVYSSVTKLLNDINKNNTDAYVIGGGEIYNAFMRHADVLYITNVFGEFKADAYAPKVAWDEWLLVESTTYMKDEDNEYKHKIQKYVRRD